MSASRGSTQEASTSSGANGGRMRIGVDERRSGGCAGKTVSLSHRAERAFLGGLQCTAAQRTSESEGLPLHGTATSAAPGSPTDWGRGPGVVSRQGRGDDPSAVGPKTQAWTEQARYLGMRQASTETEVSEVCYCARTTIIPSRHYHSPARHAILHFVAIVADLMGLWRRSARPRPSSG